MTIHIEEPHYIATVGRDFVEQADTLAQMRAVLANLFDAGMGEDVCVWEDGKRVVLILTADGRTVEMDGASLTWTWNWPERKATAG